MRGFIFGILETSSKWAAPTLFCAVAPQMQPDNKKSESPKYNDDVQVEKADWDYNWDGLEQTYRRNKGQQSYRAPDKYYVMVRCVDGPQNCEIDETKEGVITETGVQQLEKLTECISQLTSNTGFKYNIVTSDEGRCKKTAMSIKEAVGNSCINYEIKPQLNYGIPIIPDPQSAEVRKAIQDGHPVFSSASLRNTMARFDAMFSQYFKRNISHTDFDAQQAASNGSGTSMCHPVTLIVADEYFIQYAILRLQQQPIERWNNIRIKHGSVTTALVDQKGTVVVHSIGDSSYMRYELYSS